jgi:flagellar biogenesis protein FliO
MSGDTSVVLAEALLFIGFLSWVVRLAKKS